MRDPERRRKKGQKGARKKLLGGLKNTAHRRIPEKEGNKYEFSLPAGWTEGNKTAKKKGRWPNNSGDWLCRRR